MTTQPQPPVTPQVPTASAPRRRYWGDFALRLAVIAVALLVAALFATQWDRWVGNSTRQVTDDAYIRGDLTPLSAQVDGYVRHVGVDDFQRVKAGDLLVEIDDSDYRAKVAQAEADLLGAQAAIENIKARKEAQHAQVADAEAAVIGAQADVERTKLEDVRQRELLATTFGTPQKVEQADADRKRLAATLAGRQAELDAQRSQEAVLDTQELQLRAEVKAKQAALDLAKINLGYTRIAAPVAAQTLVHVHPSADELARVYQPDLAIVSSVGSFAHQAAVLAPPDRIRWHALRREARADYESFARPVACPGEVNPSDIYAWLNAHLPPDAILANGAGNYAGWLHRFYLYRQYPTLLGPTSGAMGYGVPAAIAAKLVHPERTVVACAGDGCFLMNGQELATAVQYNVPIVILVFDNGMYGTIRMHQERAYPGHVIGTDLRNPDFVALARSYGALGFHVKRTADFADAFLQAEAAKRPALIHISVDPDAISPSATLAGLRETALKKNSSAS